MKKFSFSKAELSRSYDKQDKELAFEASELGFTPLEFNGLMEIPSVFKIEITNADTKQSRVFGFQKSHLRNGEVRYWEYKSLDGITLIIFND